MVVRLHGRPEHEQELGEPMVVKVYDRRLTTKFREHHRLSPWSRELEKQHYKLICEGRAANYISHFRSQDSFWGRKWAPKCSRGRGVSKEPHARVLQRGSWSIWYSPGPPGKTYPTVSECRHGPNEFLCTWPWVQQVRKQSWDLDTVYQWNFLEWFNLTRSQKSMIIDMWRSHGNSSSVHCGRHPELWREATKLDCPHESRKPVPGFHDWFWMLCFPPGS